MAKMPPMLIELSPHPAGQGLEEPVYTTAYLTRDCARVEAPPENPDEITRKPVLLRVRVMAYGKQPVCSGCDWCCKFPGNVKPGSCVWITHKANQRPMPNQQSKRLAW